MNAGAYQVNYAITLYNNRNNLKTMIKKTTLTYLLAICTFSAFADAGKTIFGHIRDANTGEALIGAVVTLKGHPEIGSVSNEYGFYSIAASDSNTTLLASFVGYKQAAIALPAGSNPQQDISLTSVSVLAEVTVKASNRINLSNAQMGVEKLNVSDIKAIPVMFGEKDVLKTLQLLPGVKAAGDGNSGFYVRGGGADQNLVLLDEAVVYNPSHLLGFFSTFNSDAIKDVTLYKCAMPAQYGGRLSSVEDIRMNDGNSKEYHVNGGIGLIASRLNVEGPLGSENGSFLLSGRRTYADALMKLWPGNNSDQQLYFYDFNLKANYKLSQKDRVFLSVYFGKDKLGLGSDFGLDWSNQTATLRWNHLINSKLFSNTSLVYSDYNYGIKINPGMGEFKIASEIRDWNLKEEISFYPSSKASYRFGINAIQHTVTPGRVSNLSMNYVFALQDRISLEGAAYFSSHLKANENLNIDCGVRFTGFAALGPGDYYTLGSNQNVTDTTNYRSGQFVKTYVIPEPRVSISQLINSSSSVKLSYARNSQFLHLLSNSTSANPTDKWISANNSVKAGISDQVSAGYYRNLKDSQFELSSEIYYKSMQNEIDYKDGADIYSNDAIETQLLSGAGRAYGLELLLKKKTGKFTGWIGYTLSRSERKIDGINRGDWYAMRQDRTHDVSLVGIYQLTKKWTLSSTFVYSTGSAVSFPSGKYGTVGNTVFYYTERNGYRMPAYHRLDIAATKQLSHKKRFTSELTFGIYNAYGRDNAYSITFRQSPDNPDKTEAVQTTLFKIVPSITYNFKF